MAFVVGSVVSFIVVVAISDPTPLWALLAFAIVPNAVVSGCGLWFDRRREQAPTTTKDAK